MGLAMIQIAPSFQRNQTGEWREPSSEEVAKWANRGLLRNLSRWTPSDLLPTSLISPFPEPLWAPVLSHAKPSAQPALRPDRRSQPQALWYANSASCGTAGRRNDARHRTAVDLEDRGDGRRTGDLPDPWVAPGRRLLRHHGPATLKQTQGLETHVRPPQSVLQGLPAVRRAPQSPISTSGCEREVRRSASPAFRAACHARTASTSGVLTRGLA